MESIVDADHAMDASGVNGAPRRSLSVLDAIAITVGMVVGSFIFEAPALVAGSTTGPGQFITLWVVGGLISLIGALCYAELAATYPDAGGDYHFLCRAYGANTGFLFAWARLAVIQTGSIAIQAFIIGKYASAVLPLGPYSMSIYAAAVVVILTGLNISGVRQGKWTQVLLTTCEVIGVLLLIVAGFWLAGRDGAAPQAAAGVAAATTNASAIGMAMVFVLITYGGWNEAAYLSAEVRGRRGIATALFWSIGVVTAIYVLANVALLMGLGRPAMAASSAVAADLLGKAFGPIGATLISVIVVIAAASTANASIFTGARSNYAMGRDFPLLSRLGQWDDRGGTPTNALLVQAVITLALVLFGTLMRDGVRTMIDYTTPIFWAFLLLVGASLFILRRREPNIERPFRTPFYPLTPLLFCAACAYMLWSSLSYAYMLWTLDKYEPLGVVLGLVVLAAGLPLLLFAKRDHSSHARREGFEPVMAKG